MRHTGWKQCLPPSALHRSHWETRFFYCLLRRRDAGEYTIGTYVKWLLVTSFETGPEVNPKSRFSLMTPTSCQLPNRHNREKLCWPLTQSATRTMTHVCDTYGSRGQLSQTARC